MIRTVIVMMVYDDGHDDNLVCLTTMRIYLIMLVTIAMIMTMQMRIIVDNDTSADDKLR